MVHILTQLRSSIQKASPISFIANTDPADSRPTLRNLDWLGRWHCGLYQMGLAQEMQKAFRVLVFNVGYQTLYSDITLDEEV